jgi:glycosyltransferase involved in cell wall biosynthesis
VNTPSTTTLSVSVIIPCYNEEKYVGLLLDDLAAQTIKPKQVIIADSQSTDKTVAVAKSYADSLPIQIAVSAIRSPGAARNAGAKLATGDYIMFTDADNRITGTTIEQLVAATDNGRLDYVSPLFTLPSTGWFEQRVAQGINDFILSPATAERVAPGIGGCMFVRRKLHETTQGFDAQLTTEEDMNYLKDLKRTGATHTVARDLFIETSDRRFKVDGKLLILLHFLPRDWWIARNITYPLLEKLGKNKQYGMF